MPLSIFYTFIFYRRSLSISRFIIAAYLQKRRNNEYKGDTRNSYRGIRGRSKTHG